MGVSTLDENRRVLKKVLFGALFFITAQSVRSQVNRLQLNSRGYFETRGLNVLVFSNWYDGNFSDAKISGIELIHHGASVLDDALQAPVNHVHFDLYAQGPTTDSPYKPGAHIPGLNVGGWFDAGDYDIRTETQCSVVSSLVQRWEISFPKRDETTIDEQRRYVEIHRPDGVPDLIQQIEHGVLQLLAQQKAVSHAINGIVESHLYQYRHLGDSYILPANAIADLTHR